MRRPAAILSLLLALASCTRPAALEIEDAWVRDSVGRTANAAVFMTIRSQERDRLLSASTPVAKKTALMTMTSKNGAMAMDYVKAIDVPAGQPVELNATGLHVWLADLHQPLRAGQTFPLSLRFEHAGERLVTVSIIAPTAAAPAS
ncbi:copper chaperone PCu(A)C [Sphingosinicella sp. BN140058]|uniref:copper chaperone PCu(A)C n=1 Tax=Sphingosinicella sp. BN140058 TaxID=1892855 RepID=UPI0013E9DAF5|nr:copper chaperone PCu(A)C [Sphingosinicella sp. BN140058]